MSLPKDLRYYAQLSLEALAGMVGVRLYEEPRFAVIAMLPYRVQVRRYGPRVAAEVRAADPEEAFRRLFAYISGREKVAMTVPVVTQACGSAMRMQFFLPAGYGLDNAPRPADSRVRVAMVPAQDLAVLRFSGTVDGAKVARHTQTLLSALDGTSWRAAGEPSALFYDAPFTLPFMRRNEVAVRVAAL